MHSHGPVLQLLPSSWQGMQPGAQTGCAGGDTVRRASTDSMVSPTSAHLQMSSLMDREQANALYGSINSCLRETWYYIFVLSFFLLHQFCTWREYTVFQSYHSLSWLQLTEVPYRLHTHTSWVNSPWDQQEPFYWIQSRAFHTACRELGLSPNST